MFIFYSEDGGYRATDELDQEMDTIYYFGIIDICTHWGWKKWAEGVYKGIKDDWVRIQSMLKVILTHLYLAQDQSSQTHRVRRAVQKIHGCHYAWWRAQGVLR
jgi:hypothetical protein